MVDLNLERSCIYYSAQVAEFRKELDNLVFEVEPLLSYRKCFIDRIPAEQFDDSCSEAGPTYTLCFWGISQWLDKLNWQAPLM